MKMETLMSGTQSEKAHIVYKEEDGRHIGLAYEYDFLIYVMFRHIYFSCCLAEIECCLAQGVSNRESHLFH